MSRQHPTATHLVKILVEPSAGEIFPAYHSSRKGGWFLYVDDRSSLPAWFKNDEVEALAKYDDCEVHGTTGGVFTAPHEGYQKEPNCKCLMLPYVAPEGAKWERCPYVCTDSITKWYSRDDGWRCGKEEDHPSGHVLYDADGEHVIYNGTSGWRLPEPEGTFLDALMTPSPEDKVGETITRTEYGVVYADGSFNAHPTKNHAIAYAEFLARMRTLGDFKHLTADPVASQRTVVTTYHAWEEIQ